jgi:hypothetical protein
VDRWSKSPILYTTTELQQKWTQSKSKKKGGTSKIYQTNTAGFTSPEAENGNQNGQPKTVECDLVALTSDTTPKGGEWSLGLY